MNEPYVTLQGWVGSDVEIREVGETTCASFRVGSTPRLNRNGSWVDGETSWFTVNCWRGQGRNVAESLHTGDAVVVHGRVRTDVWERTDGSTSVSWIVEATVVGHDLTKGTSTFTKSVRPLAGDPRDDAGVKALVHGYDVGGPRLDSAGQEVAERPAERSEPAA